MIFLLAFWGFRLLWDKASGRRLGRTEGIYRARRRQGDRDNDAEIVLRLSQLAFTPEQGVIMKSSRGLRSTPSALLSLAVLAGGVGLSTRADAASCNAFVALNVAPPGVVAVGGTKTMTITMSTDGIDTGTHVTINRVKYDLDCDANFALGIPCTDQGDVFSYVGDGTITTTCAGTTWASNIPGGGSTPNQVVLTPSPALQIPTNSAGCSVSFDVMLDNPGNDTDGTPLQTEVVAGWQTSTSDAVCDTTPTLSSGGSNSASIDIPAPTATPTNTPTETPTATATATDTATATATETATNTATATVTDTATNTRTPTPTTTPPATNTRTATASATGTVTDTATPSPSPTATSTSICPATPASGCQTPVGFHRRLRISQKKEITTWRWRTTANVGLTDFGDPVHTTSYSLCIYAGPSATLVQELHAPPDGSCLGKPCWKQHDSKRIRYRDHSGSNDGLTHINLRAGPAELADIALRARGVNVPIPPLPLAEPVLAQLVKSDGPECWQANYSAPPLKNNSSVYLDKND